MANKTGSKVNYTIKYLNRPSETTTKILSQVWAEACRYAVLKDKGLMTDINSDLESLPAAENLPLES